MNDQVRKVVAVCPQCLRVYYQVGVPADMGAPRVPLKRDVALQARCDLADGVGEGRGRYYRVCCARCCTAHLPPETRERVYSALMKSESEIEEGRSV